MAAILNPLLGIDTARRRKSDDAGIDHGLQLMSVRLTLCSWNPVPRMICAQVCEYPVAGGELGLWHELRGRAPAGEPVAHVGLGSVASGLWSCDFGRGAFLAVGL